MSKFNPTENARLDFLIKTRGVDAAKQWAIYTGKLYRTAMMNPAHYLSREPYKSKARNSILYFIQFVRTGELT